MSMSIKSIAMVLLAAVLPNVSLAGLALDWSPAAQGALTETRFANSRDNQTFAESFTPAADILLTGMDIYSGRPVFDGDVHVGDPVVIRLYSDDLGIPGSLLYRFDESIRLIDSTGSGNTPAARIAVELSTPLSLDAGVTYWIGMSGGYPPVVNGNSISYPGIGFSGLVSVPPGGDGASAQFIGENYSHLATIVGDAAMRLRTDGFLGDDPSSSGLPPIVPEPSLLSISATLSLILAASNRRVSHQ